MLWGIVVMSAPPPLAISKMEELLIEMKSDVTRLPGELGKMPSVSMQLKMDEISTISKLAKAPVSQSVITQGPVSTPPPKPRSKSPRLIKKEPETTTTKYKVVPGPSSSGVPKVQMPSGPSLAVQTTDGLVMYSVGSSMNPPQGMTMVQAGGSTTAVAPATTSAATGGQTIAIGVPATYLDSNLYQLVPAVSGHAVSGQQVMYWPGGQGTPAQVNTVAAAPSGTQLAVVQQRGGAVVQQRGGASTTVLQPIQFGVDGSGEKGTSSVITID